MSHRPHPDEGIPIPIDIVTNPISVQEGSSMTVTITLDGTTTADTNYPVDTDHRALITVPSGQSGWPASITVPNGHSSASATFGTTGSTGATAALYTGASGADLSVPANRTATCSVALLTPPN